MTILETVIAATLVSVAIVAAVSLGTNTEKESSYSRDLSLATKYNAGAIDSLKSLRSELGWPTFVDKVQSDGSPASYCLSTLPSSGSQFLALQEKNSTQCASDLISGTRFYRLATLTVGSGGSEVTVVATTYFGGDSSRSVSTEIKLTNY